MSRKIGLEMNRERKNKLAGYLIGDFITFIVILLAFCYFHHVRVLWGTKGSDATPTFSIQKPSDTPSPTSAPTPTGSDFTPTPEPTKAPDATPTPTLSPTPTPLCDENGNPYDFSGDFGEKFGQLFSADDTVVLTDDYYRSHDLYITLTRCDGSLAQRTSKKSNRFVESHTVYFCFDIYVRNIENLYTSYSTNGRKTFANLLADSSNGETIGAISGDLFYGYESSKEVIIRNGNVIRISDYISDSICVLYWDGTMEVITHENYNKDKLLSRSPYQVWSFGPGLIAEDGTALMNAASPIWIKNPRSAIGMVEPGHYVFLAVAGIRDNDQANENGLGITMESLAQILVDHGCVVGYNLDGGASAYAGYNGDILFSVEKGSGATRLISDIICVGEVNGGKNDGQ